MSQAEIQYIITPESRRTGDVEKILNAIGEFQQTIVFPRDTEYEAFPSEDSDLDTVLVRLVRTTNLPKTEQELLQETEKMRQGVTQYFSDDDRERLSALFSGIAVRGARESE